MLFGTWYLFNGCIRDRNYFSRIRMGRDVSEYWYMLIRELSLSEIDM
jgi:hypothetical protein